MTKQMTDSLERLEIAVIKRLAWIGNTTWLNKRVKHIEPDHMARIIGYCWRESRGTTNARDIHGNDVWMWNQYLTLYRFVKDRKTWAYWKKGEQEAYDLCFYVALHVGRIQSRVQTRRGWSDQCPTTEKLYEWADGKAWTDAEGRGPLARIMKSRLALPWKSL